MTSSLRACLAAEAWKKLYPEETRGGNTKSKLKKLSFATFAKDNFKVAKSYAEQALAILNAYPDLMVDAFKLALGRRYNRTKKAANDGGKGTPKTTVDQNDPRSNTAAKLAAEHSVSEATHPRP